MQDTFACARTRPNGLNKAAWPSARVTIGHLIYNDRVNTALPIVKSWSISVFYHLRRETRALRMSSIQKRKTAT